MIPYLISALGVKYASSQVYLIGTLDCTCKILAVSASISMILGYRPEEMVGTSWIYYLIKSSIKGSPRTDRASERYSLLRRKDGGRIWLRMRFYPIVDPEAITRIGHFESPIMFAAAEPCEAPQGEIACNPGEHRLVIDSEVTRCLYCGSWWFSHPARVLPFRPRGDSRPKTERESAPSAGS